MAVEEAPIAATVVIDADLGLEAKLKLSSGSSVADLKQELCRRDYTDGLALEDVFLALADEGGNPREPLQALSDDSILAERSMTFVLLDEAPAGPLLLLPPPSTPEPSETLPAAASNSKSEPMTSMDATAAAAAAAEIAAETAAATKTNSTSESTAEATALELGRPEREQQEVQEQVQEEDPGEPTAKAKATAKATAKPKGKGKAKAKAKAQSATTASTSTSTSTSTFSDASKEATTAAPRAAACAAPGRSDDELVAAAKEALARAKDEVEETALRRQAQDTLPSINAALALSREGFTSVEENDRQAKLLVARGLLHWRFTKLSAAFEDLQRAATLSKDGKLSFLALLLCLSRWREAKELCQELGDQSATGAVQEFFAAADKMNNLFLSKEISMETEDKEAIPGVVQTDVLIPTEGAQLGVRCLFRVSSEGVRVLLSKPILLIFHSEEETVETYSQADFLDLVPNAHVIVAGFRGYGFSSGSPSCLARLRSDGDAVVDILPGLFKSRGLPWPWPGRLTLYGSSLGSRVACYLAALRGESTFTGGLVLESAWCGSFAPGAKPLPEPPRHMALAAMGSNAMGDSRFGSRELSLASLKVGREAGRLLPIKPKGGTSHICFMRGSEDFLRAYTGRLLLLHGELDHVVPPEHARRLCDAAESATRRLVLVRGKRFDSVRAGPEYERELRSFLEGK